MSNRFNPYSEWLQVHSSSPRPTYYELLNVSPNESNTTVIKAAAITQIKKLQALEPGSRGDLRDRVEKEVRRSFQVLTDAKARGDYDQELLNESVSQNDLEPPPNKGVAQNDLEPPPNKSVSQKDLEPPPKKSVSQNDLEPPSSKSIAPAIPVAKPVSAAEPLAADEVSATPLMAKPVSQPTPQAIVPQAIVPPAIVPPAITELETQNPKTGTNHVQTRRLYERRRARKQRTVVLALGILMLAGMASMLGFIMSRHNDLEKPTNSTDTLAAKSDSPSDQDVNPELKNGNENKDPTLSQSPPDPVSEANDRTEKREDSETTSQVETPGTRDETPTIVRRISPTPTITPDIEPRDIEPRDIDPKGIDPKNIDPTPPVREAISFEDLKALPVAEQYQLKNHYCDVKNLWRQQRFDEIPAIVSRIQTGPHGEELGAAILETNTKLRAFWERFARSCQEFPGRQIEIDDRVVGIVERRPNSIILRIAGTNRDYEHRFVPPGLMMAITDQVAEPDDFDYELEKAAYYISQISAYPKYSKRADELLAEFEDTQDVASELRLMSELEFCDLGETIGKEERVTYRTDRKLSDGLKEVFELTSTRRTPPAKALEAMRVIFNAAATPSDGSHFGIDDTSDKQELLQRRMVMLETARTYGVRSGYTPLVMDIVNEISSISRADKDAVQYESLIDLSQTAGLDQEHAKLYCEEVLFVARESSTYSPKELYRLCQAGLKVAEKQNLRLFGIQLVNKLDSLAKGN